MKEMKMSRRFESSVILNGSKTDELAELMLTRFESSAILNGSKTISIH